MSGASELSCVSDPDAVWPRDAVIMAPGRGQPGATLYRFPRYLRRAALALHPAPVELFT